MKLMKEYSKQMHYDSLKILLDMENVLGFM